MSLPLTCRCRRNVRAVRVRKAATLEMEWRAEMKYERWEIAGAEWGANGEFQGVAGMFYPAIKKFRNSNCRLSCAAIYDGNRYGYLISAELNDDSPIVLVADLPCETAEEASNIAFEREWGSR